MTAYEYRVVPAPKRGTKARGVKSNEDRFALTLETLMNELGAEGWEYVRADTLPSEERSGLTSRTTVYQHLLVFRRTLAEGAMPRIVQEEEAVGAKRSFSADAPVGGPTPKLVATRDAAVRADDDDADSDAD